MDFGFELLDFEKNKLTRPSNRVSKLLGFWKFEFSFEILEKITEYRVLEK
jgi:hypothetical protein